MLNPHVETVLRHHAKIRARGHLRVAIGFLVPALLFGFWSAWLYTTPPPMADFYARHAARGDDYDRHHSEEMLRIETRDRHRGGLAVGVVAGLCALVVAHQLRARARTRDLTTSFFYEHLVNRGARAVWAYARMTKTTVHHQRYGDTIFTTNRTSNDVVVYYDDKQYVVIDRLALGDPIAILRELEQAWPHVTIGWSEARRAAWAEDPRSLRRSAVPAAA